MKKLKEYTLDNGDVVTSKSLMDLGLTKDMVRYRLKKSTDPNLIYKGSKKELNEYSDPKKIFKEPIHKPKKKVKPKKRVRLKVDKWGSMSEERIALQPMSDPLYKLMLKTI
jgi:hypothetical protein